MSQFVAVVQVFVVYNELVRQVFITHVVQAIMIQGSHECAHNAAHFECIPTAAWVPTTIGCQHETLLRVVSVRNRRHIREEWHHDSQNIVIPKSENSVPMIATQQHESGGAIICLSTHRYRPTFLAFHRMADPPL